MSNCDSYGSEAIPADVMTAKASSQRLSNSGAICKQTALATGSVRIHTHFALWKELAGTNSGGREGGGRGEGGCALILLSGRGGGFGVRFDRKFFLLYSFIRKPFFSLDMLYVLCSSRKVVFPDVNWKTKPLCSLCLNEETSIFSMFY